MINKWGKSRHETLKVLSSRQLFPDCLRSTQPTEGSSLCVLFTLGQGEGTLLYSTYTILYISAHAPIVARAEYTNA